MSTAKKASDDAKDQNGSAPVEAPAPSVAEQESALVRAPKVAPDDKDREVAAENAKRKAEAERKLNAGEADPDVTEAVEFRTAHGYLPAGWVQDGAAIYKQVEAE